MSSSESSDDDLPPLPASWSLPHAVADVPVAEPVDDVTIGTCIICLSEIPVGEADQLVRCPGSESHAICDSCFEPYVRGCIEKLARTNLLASKAEKATADGKHAQALQLAGRIVCPLSGPCGGCDCEKAFDDKTIALHVNPETFESYVEARSMLRKVQRALQRGAELRALFPNARMCGRCRYGPVEHTGCASLTTHHGEAWRSQESLGIMGGHARIVMAPDGRITVRGPASTGDAPALEPARIDNGCPACGWFASSIEEWQPWDGIVRTRGAVAGAGTADVEAEAAVETEGSPFSEIAINELQAAEDEEAAAQRRHQRQEELRRFRDEHRSAVPGLLDEADMMHDIVDAERRYARQLEARANEARRLAVLDVPAGYGCLWGIGPLHNRAELREQAVAVELAIQAIEQQPVRAPEVLQQTQPQQRQARRLAETMFTGHVAREQAPRRRGNRRGQQR
mgnify:CR=1 FL=1|tara:strand:- start:668 stop:2032 length:1365 start_codon:yes stop_codon:yes gene_type:complete